MVWLAAVLAIGVLASATATATATEVELVLAREDYAGRYRDRDAKADVYLFVGGAEGVEEKLLAHYGDASRFRIESATYTLAELRAVHAEIDDRWAEFAAAGLEIRETGVDQRDNRVDVGAYHSLGPTREALAEYGDMIQVEWSQGGFIGGQPVAGAAVKTVDEVKVRLTLDEYPLVAGEPAWLTGRVKNGGDTPIRYITSTCDILFGVRGTLVGEAWRQGTPADVGAIKAAGRNEWADLRWRAEEDYAGDETIHVGFAPKGALGPEDWGCGGDIAVPHRLPPGGVEEWRLRWDGGTIGTFPAGTFGPPPEGLARLTGSFDFRREGTTGKQTIEIVLDVPVANGRDPELLHPMEAVDAALADDAFRELIEQVELGDRFGEYIAFDDDRNVWVVGACASHRPIGGSWKAAVLDPVTGEVRRILDRVTGKRCHKGPWK